MRGKMIATAALALAVSLPAFAKLPAPPPLTEEQKVKAEEAKQRAAWSGKVAAYQQCQAENTVAEKYLKSMKAKGKDVKVGDLAPCVNPGPFQVATAAPAAPAAAAPVKQ